MENFKELHEQESTEINGGTNNVYPGPDGGGCTPDPLGDLIRGGSTGPTFPDPTW